MSTPQDQKYEQMLRSRLQLCVSLREKSNPLSLRLLTRKFDPLCCSLKTCSECVHIISTPFTNAAGREAAKRTAEEHERNSSGCYCYNPNEDCPQSLGVSWLNAWHEICKNTQKTGGTCFVMYRSDGKEPSAAR